MLRITQTLLPGDVSEKTNYIQLQAWLYEFIAIAMYIIAFAMAWHCNCHNILIESPYRYIMTICHIRTTYIAFAHTHSSASAQTPSPLNSF